MSGGVKHDAGKTRYELLPPEFLEAVAKILTHGAKVYADRNWEGGLKYSRAFGALMRHLWAWWRGESLDKESGESHLWHAGCELAFLITFEARNRTDLDDRPNVSQARNDVHTERPQAPAAPSTLREDGESVQARDSGRVVFGAEFRPVDRVQVYPYAGSGYHRRASGPLGAAEAVDKGEIA